MSQKSPLSKLTLAIVLALLLMGLATLAFAQDFPVATDGPTGGNDFPLEASPNINGDTDPVNEPLFMIGDYCGGFGGVSLHDQPTGTFTVPLTGELKTVYVLWSGRNIANTGDDTISVSVNGSAPQLIQASPSLTADSDGGFYWFTYAYNASADKWPFQQGVNDITVSGLTDGASATFEPHGVGLLLVGEDADACPFQAIGIYYGNDVFYHGWDGASGPNSKITCLDVASPPDPVEMDIQMFVGGVENPQRSNAIWVETGSGADPTDIISSTDAVELRMALKGLQGDEFDNYDTLVQDPRPIIVEPGETWACVQIESPKTPYAGKEQGISATWINLAVRLPVAEIEIEPDGLNPVGVAHTFTVTVHSSFGFESLVISPTVEPAPEAQSDTCATPSIAGGIATCTMTINSSTPGVFTATAEAAIGIDVEGLGGKTAYISTSQSRESENGPAVKTYYEPSAPAIDLEKATNGEDADEPTGPYINVGDPVTWTYEVTNSGNVTLTEVTVVDDQGVDVDCPQETLAPGESMTCTGTGIAVAGQYANQATVTGRDPTGEQVTDNDPSHYFGSDPAITIEKATNGQDADEPTGPQLVIGGPVTWTYEVTNIGNVTLTDVTVTDDQDVEVSCPEDALAPEESMTCTGTGIAALGQYANMGDVVGISPTGAQVEDNDPSHYFGGQPDGIDDPEIPGPDNTSIRIFLPLIEY